MTLPIWSIAPFLLLLGSIAVLPLCAERWWHRNRNRALVSAMFALPFAIWLVREHGQAGEHALHEALRDYGSFVTLLGALFVIAGGIHVRGSLAGTPLSNTALLAIGALLSNLIGTTGASMVLIRPLLRANRTRVARAHLVVFLIFIVANCGGLLTPLGDPPLYLGFLKGVPFFWTSHLWKEWAAVNSILLATFLAVDSYVLDREERARPGSQLEELMKHEPLRIEGRLNVLLLLAVIAVLFAKGRGLGSAEGHWPFGVVEALLLGLALVSWITTKRAAGAANQFTFGPIVEVAVLFAGIFVTMVAPLHVLNARGGQLGLHEPWQYFWATGALSAVLDNAPTYLTLAATACGQAGIGTESAHYLGDFLSAAPRNELILAAISSGAVLMGALTYIANGPNFMVKAIAESNGVKMPSFFGYLAWSGAVLLPTFALVTWFFFV